MGIERGEDLLVFEVWIKTKDGGQGKFEAHLPTSGAARCDQLEVVIDAPAGNLGRHLSLTCGGDPVLDFPWVDHADAVLRDDPDKLPIRANEEWNDLEEGWWASVIPHRGRVYLAQCDFDAMRTSATVNPEVEVASPGRVKVNAVDVSWRWADSDAYEAAWTKAIAICQAG